MSDEPFAKGKRGLTFLRKVGEKVLLVKRKNPASAVDTIANEAKFTKLLNQHGIGPRFISYDGEELLREFIDGEELRHWIGEATAGAVRDVLRGVLQQCRTMDELGINKFEMTRPWKHIIVREGRPYLIDFERCRESLEPKNVTQFCQFLTSSRLTMILKEKNIFIDRKILDLAKKYKQNIKNNEKESNRNLFEELLRAIGP